MSVRSRLIELRSSIRREVRERGWLVPTLGAILGIVLAEIVSNVEGTPNPARWAVSVDRARDTLLAALAIVFTGLSIVLALGTMVAQTQSSRFSIRLLRQRGLRGRVVVGVFAMTTAFIVTSQLELRALPADTLAPQSSLMIAAVLVLVSGATIIWYINATMQSLRLDRAMRQVIRAIRRTLRIVERRRESAVPLTALETPPGAIPLRAHRRGYIAGVDTPRLHRLTMQAGSRIGVEVLVGTPVVNGQRIGWVLTPDDIGLDPIEIARVGIQIARSRDPEYDTAYGVRILVDMAVTALSPAVNDPYTAVEVLNELTFVLIGLAQHRPGPRGHATPDGKFRVVRAGRSLGDYLDLATAPILVYGATDPQVVEALGGLAETVETVCETEADRERAQDLARRVASAAAELREAGPSANTGGAQSG